jgi:hypothetical protein
LIGYINLLSHSDNHQYAGYQYRRNQYQNNCANNLLSGFHAPSIEIVISQRVAHIPNAEAPLSDLRFSDTLSTAATHLHQNEDKGQCLQSQF